MTKANSSQPSLDLLAIGEALIDLISLRETRDGLRGAGAFGRHLGGSTTNVAINVAKLGGTSAVVSKTGTDAFGQFIKDELERHRVDTKYLVQDPNARTSVVFISRTTGTPDFMALRGADYALTSDEVPEEAIARAGIVHASTFALSREPCRSAVTKALRLAHSQGKIVSLDPNYSPRIWPDYEQAQQVVRSLCRYVTVIKPSLDDASRFFGPEHTPEQYIRMFHELGPETVILTRGKEGVLTSYQGRIVGHMPVRPVEAVDATGAGDAFWAGFLVAKLDGRPLEKCVLFAREIAELKMAAVGPLSRTIDRQAVYASIGAAETWNA